MHRHLLLTNDFPPKVGGIQNYLWELWRRLDRGVAGVYCTPHPDSATFDAAQPFPIQRSREPVLVPYPWLLGRVRRLMASADADLVLIDPAFPLGLIGPFLRRPYGVVLHGAEVTIPARLPVTGRLMARVLEGASLVVSAGGYALAEAERCVGHPLPGVVIPPGVDSLRFIPPTDSGRVAARERFGIETDHIVVAAVTRLVPRKGMHTLIQAAALLQHTHPRLRVLIGGDGRQRRHLRRLVSRLGAPVDLLGPLADDDVVLLYQAADVMAMPCSQRWWGLEQEGFGIVYLEAAACGIPQLAGRSGGADEAVVEGETGFVVDDASDPVAVAAVLARLIDDQTLRSRLGTAARARVVERFGYPHLADTLRAAIDAVRLDTVPIDTVPINDDA